MDNMTEEKELEYGEQYVKPNLLSLLGFTVAVYFLMFPVMQDKHGFELALWTAGALPWLSFFTTIGLGFLFSEFDFLTMLFVAVGVVVATAIWPIWVVAILWYLVHDKSFKSVFGRWL